ncbi:isoprenylcysteine carboxylmethyltransferase family protein [Caldichromatium japonicum]|uniref:Isoprenylcysteine carboxylmethyltransferase family protein n=1 Tax=Caldichromatium japonicum TaxID=2699430 RepID=A0A6G7VBE3_9GAMM|nr:methyltransferase [Caldichromatium japonicum]QIK37294.1 isoprenylcysteine carboxylmethyltransferase family protein [Caldichromatium japonicum]
MSMLKILKGEHGEYLVVLQFVLFFVFVLTPAWNPLATPAVLSILLIPRWLLLGLCWLIAILFSGLGVLHIRDYLTPLPYPVEHNRLVKQGAYAWVRHPLYSSLIFAGLGWICFTLSLSHLLILIIGFILLDYKASKEEHWLTERHPEYADYARRVRKFIPWIY